MWDWALRIKDRVIGSSFIFEAPAALRAEGHRDTCKDIKISGKIAANRWTLDLGFAEVLVMPKHSSPDTDTDIGMTYAVFFNKSRRLAAPNGSETFTNNQIMAYIDSAYGAEDVSKETSAQIYSFRSMAHVCGWRKPRQDDFALPPGLRDGIVSQGVKPRAPNYKFTA